MGIEIDDGAHGTSDGAGVKENRLDVNARMGPRIYYNSRDKGTAFTFLTSYNVTGSPSYAFYFKNKNLSLDHFVIDHIIVGGAKEGFFELITVTGDPTGTTVTGMNANTISNKTASATTLGEGVSQITEGSKLAHRRSAAYQTTTFSTNNARILGQEKAMAVKYTGANGTIDVELLGFWE